jgi:hypothetical protein
MRKLSLLVGTLGGAMAGYLFSNSKLREELADAKDAEQAGKILAKHLQKDGKQLGSHVKKFVDSDDVQKNLGKAKTFAQKQLTKANDQLRSFMKTGAATASKKAQSAADTVHKKAKKAIKKAA